MSALIKVTARQIGDGTIQTVDARELHSFLESKQDFSTWVKQRISQYDFAENVDFVRIHRKMEANNATLVEYAISTDMAKEMAMVERNAKGKVARQYFIECERQAKAGAKSAAELLADPAALRAALIDYSSQVIELKQQVQEMSPKAEFHDAVATAINSQTVQEVAKVLATGQNRLFAFLRDEKFLMTDNLPYQRHIDEGHFVVVQKKRTDRHGQVHLYPQTLVTGKGMMLIRARIASAKKLPLVEV